MEIIKDIQKLKERLRIHVGTIGFVPTMGALHRGHVSLIDRSVEENDLSIVSIYVNPTQFLPGEDLQKYPRREEADLKICKVADVDIVFMPQSEEIYGKDEVKIIAPRYGGFVLEGFRRPGHFDGVLQIVSKLFHIVHPTRAYFGKKDAQQLYLIQKMVRDLMMDVDVVPCELMRDSDGLALSSRNVYLSDDARQKALAIPRSLKKAAKSISSGQKSVEKLTVIMKETLCDVELEYIAFVDRDFHPIQEVEIKNSLILVAAKVGNVRLIDNIWI